jgi:hypothetical protein
MVLGECCNFAAYGLAPASLVAGLDAVAVVSNAVTAPLPPRRVARANALGAMMVAVGVAAIIFNAPQEAEAHHGGGEEEGEKTFSSIRSWTAVAFAGGICAAALWIANPMRLSVCISRAAKRDSPLYHCAASGMMGTLTVISGKSLAAALFSGRLATAFNRTETGCLTIVLLVALVASIALQLLFLTAALLAFGLPVVVPAYYAAFTALAISAGAAVFRETVFPPGSHAVVFVAGLALALAGVAAVSGEDCSSGGSSRHGGAVHASDEHEGRSVC